MPEFALFLREFLRNFHTTGAILPSGRWLARALVRHVRKPAAGPRRILEVGPGTGSVTRRLIAALQPADHLDLVELNASFVDRLNHRFAVDPHFQAVAGRCRVLHCSIEDLRDDERYNLIVSGLPLNNFSVDLVERILSKLAGLLAPGGTLSFFEYIAIRRARALVSRGAERARLKGIGHAMQQMFDGSHELRRDWVWPNVPPAWVHHLRR